MGRPVVPVRSLSTRLPDAGRIRIGVKVPMAGKDKRGRPKMRPEKIDRFRFTSQDRTALDQVAEIYGGQVTPWDEPKAAPGQFQVITDANELRIALPPDPLGNTPIYELWGGGGCERRCDGETCERITKGQDGFDLVQVDCICFRKGALECQLKTRLSVLLPEVRFAGVWRLDTNGRNAAEELPGMVDLIRSLQDRGIIRATMRVEWRRQVLDGQTQEFAVPVLGVDQSLDQLAAGQARMGALSAAQPVGEIGAGSGPGEGPAREGSVDGVEPVRDADPVPAPDPDDEIVDAEIVDAEIVGDDDIDRATLEALADTGPKRSRALRAAVTAAKHGGLGLPASFEHITDPDLIRVAVSALGGDPAPPPREQVSAEAGDDQPIDARRVGMKAHDVFEDLVDPEKIPRGRKTWLLQALRHALVYAVTEGEVSSSKHADGAQLYLVWGLLEDIAAGNVAFEFNASPTAGVEWKWADGSSSTVLWTELTLAEADAEVERRAGAA